MTKLLIGPVLPPVHGQSLAFTRFIDSLDSNEKIVINTNLEEKNKFGKIFFTCRTLFKIFIFTLFLKVDTVYFTCSRSFLGSLKDILLINLANFRGIKVVNHLHGSDFYEFLHSSPKWFKFILLKSYNKVHTSIVLLEGMKSQFCDFKDMNLEVVENFYDEELENKISQKDKNTIHVLYLSNIIKSKGIFELLEAFEIISKEFSYVFLHVAGDFIADEYMSIGEVKTKFNEKIKNKKYIKYHGKIYGEEKVKLLQTSDIFVLPSFYKSEAFPISIIEAMICKNAIITTNYKYLPNIVKNENGVLVEPQSVESLKTGLEELINDKEKLRTMQKNNFNKAKENYSLKKYIKKLHEIVN